MKYFTHYTVIEWSLIGVFTLIGSSILNAKPQKKVKPVCLTRECRMLNKGNWVNPGYRLTTLDKLTSADVTINSRNKGKANAIFNKNVYYIEQLETCASTLQSKKRECPDYIADICKNQNVEECRKGNYNVQKINDLLKNLKTDNETLKLRFSLVENELAKIVSRPPDKILPRIKNETPKIVSKNPPKLTILDSCNEVDLSYGLSATQIQRVIEDPNGKFKKRDNGARLSSTLQRFAQSPKTVKALLTDPSNTGWASTLSTYKGLLADIKSCMKYKSALADRSVVKSPLLGICKEVMTDDGDWDFDKIKRKFHFTDSGAEKFIELVVNDHLISTARTMPAYSTILDVHRGDIAMLKACKDNSNCADHLHGIDRIMGDFK